MAQAENARFSVKIIVTNLETGVETDINSLLFPEADRAGEAAQKAFDAAAELEEDDVDEKEE